MQIVQFATTGIARDASGILNAVSKQPDNSIKMPFSFTGILLVYYSYLAMQIGGKILSA